MQYNCSDKIHQSNEVNIFFTFTTSCERLSLNVFSTSSLVLCEHDTQSEAVASFPFVMQSTCLRALSAFRIESYVIATPKTCKKPNWAAQAININHLVVVPGIIIGGHRGAGEEEKHSGRKHVVCTIQTLKYGLKCLKIYRF